MVYTDGANRFELPRLTMGLQERYDAARAADTPREAVKLKLDLMRDALGVSYVEERCGSAQDVEAVDVAELDALFIDVTLAYGMHGLREIGAALSQIAPMLEQMERINAITGASNRRQGFSRVV